MGDLDMLDEVKGVGVYDDLVRESIEVDLDGHLTKILSVGALIKAKEAANREKDKPGLQVLYALCEANDPTVD